MYKIKPLLKVKKKIQVPADKSISHRAVILSSLSKGTVKISPFLVSDDTKATLECMKRLGVRYKLKNTTLTISGVGKYFNLTKRARLYAHESGTTIRILSGLLAAQKFATRFSAAPSLNKRPMKRVVSPLQKMGAKFSNKEKKSNIFPPLLIEPCKEIKNKDFKLKISSAQVKSAILLASLYGDKKISLTEPVKSRDHTEKMLKLFGVKITTTKNKITCYPCDKLKGPKKIFIPSDFSSAAFFIVLGLILKDSEIIIKNVNINPTRAQLIKVLRRMGAKITLKSRKNYYEPYADIVVKSSKLKATIVLKNEIPAMIDEIPILCVAASLARGKTVIKGVKELKVKETDRIKSMVYNLKKAGINIEEKLKINKDRKLQKASITIYGKSKIDKEKINFKSFGDHRTAMSMFVFSAAAGNSSYIDDIKCINKSFPEFKKIFESLYT